MSINKFNAEGYYDPTAFEALTKIEREAKEVFSFRPIVYICSPLSGDVAGNQEKARLYCRYAVDKGYVPIAPHIYFTQFMSDNTEKERNLAVFMDIVLLSKCAELWFFGDGQFADAEWYARHKSKPVRRFTTECEEVSP